MPANLPPVYHNAEDRLRAAKSPEEKLAALQEMLRLLPKHKGTDRLQADLKARIAKLKRQPKKGATRAFTHYIPREGAGQVALAGPPNGGKSSLVARLTHATPEVADYPYTTREPVPGMMRFEDIAFQLLDLPPLGEHHVEPWVYDMVRGADLLWVVVDCADSLDGLESTRRLLGDRRIDTFPAGEPPPRVPTGAKPMPALLVVTGRDRPEAVEDLEILESLLDHPWPTVAVSATDGTGLDDLRRRTFEALQIIRVYTKQPGKSADRESPFTLPIGATVADLARTIHRDLSEQLRFARLWGSTVFDGQTVHRDHVLAEGDVVEIHL